MASEDVKRIMLGVIILIIGLAIFVTIFSEPECNEMANITAQQLADAIDAAVELDSSGTSEPDRSETWKYISVPVRLCDGEVSLKQIFLHAGANRPKYEIYYEHFPNAGVMASWEESYPWSGGIMSQLMLYGGMKLGTAGIGKAFKFAKTGMSTFIKAGKKVWHLPAAVWMKAKSLIKYLKDTRIGNAIAERISKSSIKKSSSKFLRESASFKRMKTWYDGSSIRKYMDDRKWATGVVSDMKTEKELRDLDEMGFLAKRADGVEYDAVGKPIFNYKDRKVVIAANMMIADMSNDQAKLFRQTYNVPRSYTWFSIKETVMNNKRFSSFYEKTKNLGKKITKPFKDSKVKKRTELKEFLGKGKGSLMEPDKVQKIIDMDNICIANPSRCKKYYEALYASGLPNKKVRSLSYREIQEQAMKRQKMIKSNDYLIFVPEGTQARNYLGGDDVLPRETTSGFLGESYITEDYLKSNTKWDDLPAEIQFGITDNVAKRRAGQGALRNADDLAAAKNIWEAGRKGYNNKIDGFGATGYTGARNAMGMEYFNKHLTEDPAEMAVMKSAFNGEVVYRDSVDILLSKDNRVKRAVLYDIGRYYNPFWFGAYRTQEAELNTAKEFDTENSLVLVSSGSVANTIELDEDVADYGVSIYRPKPDNWERTPIFMETIMFDMSIKEHPDMYTVSPCFGYYKVWKGTKEGENDNTIFVKVVKCDEGDNAANYCYATEEDLWGLAPQSMAGDIPPLSVHLAYWAGIWGSCTAGSFGTAERGCAKIASWATIGFITVESTMMSILEDEDAIWGYWNYYKAADICDIVDMMGGFGEKAISKEGAKAAAKSYAKGGFTADLCIIPYTIGDIVSSWPNPGYLKLDLDKDTIKSRQADCVWDASSEKKNKELTE